MSVGRSRRTRLGSVVAVEEPVARSELCREILTALPGWFGIEEAVERYVR
jgi:hypothetical protein